MSGELVIGPSASGTVEESGDSNQQLVSVTGTLRNEGSVTVSGGALLLEPSGVIDNASGATLELDAEGTVNPYQPYDQGIANEIYASGYGQLVNEGTIVKASGTGSTAVNAQIDNEGTIDAQSGTLSFSGGSIPFAQDVLGLPSIESGELDSPTQCPSEPNASVGAWTAENGATIRLSQDCYTFGAASRLTGDFQVNGVAQLGPVRAPDASIIVGGYGSLLANAEPFQTQPAQIGDLNVNDQGVVGGTGELDVCDQFTAASGTLAGPGAVVLCSGATGAIAPDSSPFVLDGALLNRGSLTWSQGDIAAASPGMLWNAGTFAADSDGGVYESTQPSVIYNADSGTITKSSGSGTTEIDALLYNDGAAPSASSGQLTFAGDNLTAPDQSGGQGQGGSCSELGETVAVGWVQLVSDPVQVIAGTAGAACSGDATASGSVSLDAGSYPDEGSPVSLASGQCDAASSCIATAGTVVDGGAAGYWSSSTGAVYSITANFSYSPGGSQSPWVMSLPIAPSASGAPTIPPPSTHNGGSNPANPNAQNAMCGDPVVCSTGDQTETETDLSMGGTGGGLDLTRTYNSQLAAAQSAPGAFGYGWTGPMDTHLTVDAAAQTATVENDNGSTVAFTINPDGSYSAPAGAEATLTQDSDGDYDYTLPSQEVIRFNADGNIVSDTDATGQTTTYTRNHAGQVTAITAPSGRAIQFSYNAQGLVASATDPAGLEVDYGYDSAENLIEVVDQASDNTDVGSYRWQFGYDGSHELTSMRDADGSLTQIAYSAGTVASQTDPMGHQTTWSYGPGETEITQPNGSVTRELFDPSGEPVAITRAVGTSDQTTQTFTYNALLEPVQIVNGGGRITRYGYDAAGDRTSQTDPDGNTTQWTYDADRNVTSMTVPSGETTTYTYNGSNELMSTSRPAPGGQTQTTSMTYNAQGNLSSETDPRGKETQYDYNDEGDLVTEIDPAQNVQTWTYDADGRPASSVSPRGNLLDADVADYTTVYDYDELGRLTKVTDPDGNATTYAYDPVGNQTSTANPGGHTTTVDYNAADQVQTIHLPDGSNTEGSTYNTLGLLASQTNQAGQTTTYTYNLLGELTRVTDPGNRQINYGYDAAGNQTSITNNDGQTTQFRYNGDAQVTSINYPGTTATASFAYTPDGQVQSMSDGTGTSSYSYDQLDRLTSQTDGDGQTIGYGYDLADNQTSITYPDGNQIARTFSDDEQLQTVTDWLGNTTTFSYDPDGNLQTTQLPAATGETDTNTYDPADQLTDQTFQQNGSTLAGLHYHLESNGQLHQETQTGLPGAASLTYGYNTDDQLASVDDGTSTGTYAYNVAGDPTTRDGTSGYSYDNLDQLSSSPSASYTYNDLGQRTSTTTTDGITSYGYDQAGRLTSVNTPSGDSTGYRYDGNGLIASQTIDGATTHFAWDTSTGTPTLLSDGSNDYIDGPDGQPFEQIDQAGNPTYLHSDRLGSIRLLTDATGNVTAATTYTPYGQIAEQTGTATTPFGYAGQWTDSSTGMQYDDARWYDPATAQFLTQDPLRAVSQQPYNYADDDPVDLTDPTGLITLQSVSNFAAGVGSVLSFGLTTKIDDALGDNINTCSSAFSAGAAFGGALGIGEAMIAPEGEIADAALTGGDELGPETEVVNRYMSQAELEATQETGLVRGGREGTHFVTDDVYSLAHEAQSRLSLPQTPEVHVQLEVPRGAFSSPSTVEPDFGWPGGGTERTATGAVPTRVVSATPLG